ncbi:PfkB family carbohydrate kinase [Variovorax sp. RHLX14]|uniref:nucleoside 2-deoxyribosyltransferase n=1 Tax=Variovorax sp. RHLX14 TaxID=1259731 RepID=UPI003F477FD5
MTMQVVGGVYAEQCIRPRWNEIYGSAGRAAVAIAAMEVPVALHAYMDKDSQTVFDGLATWNPKLRVLGKTTQKTVQFRYLHDLSVPQIDNVPPQPWESFQLTQEKIVRFGMLETDAVVHAEWAVYDPQNGSSGVPFGANGSTANFLAVVLNVCEAALMAGVPGAPPEQSAPLIASQQNAAVVVIKMGPLGAFVWTPQGVAQVPAYRTSTVWKIGSGDVFVAHFALAWMHEALAPVAAAERASRATAYYCETKTFPSPEQLAAYQPPAIVPSPETLAGKKRSVYLAGPFFDLMQQWMVEEALHVLQDMGLNVFSPFHEVGMGTAANVVQKDLEGIRDTDMLFAIADGLDAGTVYEIGYARALAKPVIVYSERHSGREDLKMMQGSGCVLCDNFTTAVYTALWAAVEL